MNNNNDIRFISLDLDGTALDRDDQHAWLADDLVDALNELGERGVRWCMNSGRSYQNQIGIAQACRRLDNMPVAILSGERFIHWISPKRGPHEPFNTDMLRRLEVMHPRVVAALTPHFERFRAKYRFTHEQDVDLIVGWNLASIDQVPAFEAELTALLADVPEAQLLRNATWMIITHRDAGKGRVLEETARCLGIAREQILAVGDHLNDLDMLDGRAAGHVGCPADADEAIKTIVRQAGGMVSALNHTAGTVDIIRTLTR